MADGDISIFSKGTLRAVHQITGGIPRVINLLCDRALTLSFTKQHAVVKKPIFLAAAEQILGEDVVSQRVQGQNRWYLTGAFVLALVCGYAIGSLYV